MGKKHRYAKDVFFLANGWELKTLVELVNALDIMDEGTFNCHVNAEKNDFANWIRHSFDKKELADALPSERKDMQLCLLKHIVRWK